MSTNYLSPCHLYIYHLALPSLQDGLELGNVNGEVPMTGEHETGPRDKTAGISIRGLLKKFSTPKGKMTAVDGLYLDMYEDQITSLLGHNGAGQFLDVMSMI